MIRATLVLLAGMAFESLSSAQTVALEEIFPLAGQEDYSPAEMVANVGGEFPDATATMSFTLSQESTSVVLDVSNSVPNAYFTVWLRLERASPLTGAIATPLANPSDLSALAPSTPATSLTLAAQTLGMLGDDGSGAVGQANGFLTDASGNSRFVATLDFPLVLGGVFPFDEFDASLEAVPFGDSPFAIRVVSHAFDQVGHGLIAGKHEMWFQTTSIPVPEPSGLILCASSIIVAATCRRLKRRSMVRA